jgi:hypothetical protein
LSAREVVLGRDDAVAAADLMKDLDAVRDVLARTGVKRNGSITAAFTRIGKEQVSYSNRPYMFTETR